MRSNGYSEIRQRKAPDSQNEKPECNPGRGPGRLTVVSLGPGSSLYLVPRAKRALERAEVVVGYKTYLELIEPGLLAGKKIISSGMRQEIARCRAAVEETLGGRETAVVSSGDAGIYGMAGLILEILAEEGFLGSVEMEVVPGVPAFSAASALLGAPLMHDFAVISLSDLMTPWEMIEARVEAAAKADFVLVLYNPRSKRRDWQLGCVKEMILKYRGKDTPVGIVRNAAREGEWVQITSLSELDETVVDMLTMVIIGNSGTRVLGGKMVTPRGYHTKYPTRKEHP
ncbi:MAG: precorrin-3B C(17)-methyltransferase [Deltaproteobacteria bacterium]|nr:precorrin-3B C(17)-methyltransferase [Deltaproteobacteria bacterium]